MRRITGWWLAAYVFGVVAAGYAQGGGAAAPSLSVVCSPMVAKVRIDGPMPSGASSVEISNEAVTLVNGERYTLFVSTPGYIPYIVSFTASWSGTRQKSVSLEKGVGPTEGEVWIADLEDKRQIEFMPIPAGSFMMGAEFGDEDERPVHRVDRERGLGPLREGRLRTGSRKRGDPGRFARRRRPTRSSPGWSDG